MNFVALKILTGDRAKYLGLIFAIAFSTFLLQNQTSIFAGILKRNGRQILDVTDAEIWVMSDKSAISSEEFTRRRSAVETAQARLDEGRAQLTAAAAQIKMIEI